MVERKENLLIGQKQCYILLPGSSGGIYHPLMQMVFNKIAEQDLSVCLMEYPYQTKGGEPPQNNLDEEIYALKEVLEDLSSRGYRRFVYVCKSLGGLVATWLMRERSYHDACDGIYILGCVVDRGEEKGIDMTAASDKIKLIVQGELDDYGNAETVRALLYKYGCVAEVVEILDGDHSYRHRGSKDIPTHETEAISALMKSIFS